MGYYSPEHGRFFCDETEEQVYEDTLLRQLRARRDAIRAELRARGHRPTAARTAAASNTGSRSVREDTLALMARYADLGVRPHHLTPAGVQFRRLVAILGRNGGGVVRDGSGRMVTRVMDGIAPERAVSAARRTRSGMETAAKLSRR